MHYRQNWGKENFHIGYIVSTSLLILINSQKRMYSLHLAGLKFRSKARKDWPVWGMRKTMEEVYKEGNFIFEIREQPLFIAWVVGGICCVKITFTWPPLLSIVSSRRNNFSLDPHFCRQHKHIPLQKMIIRTTCKAVNCFSSVARVKYSMVTSHLHKHLL